MSATSLGCAAAGAGGSGSPSAPGAGDRRGSGAPASTVLAGPWFFRRSPEAAGGVQAPEASDAGLPRSLAADVGGWMPASVPGCVHTDLLAAGRIGDPFVGQNEKDQQWIDEVGWDYRTTFEADDALLARQHVELVFKGLDTYADVLLNGQVLLRANNMFREWRADTKPLLRRGSNELLVAFRSPIHEVKAGYDRLGYVLPAANDQATPMVSMFTRKAPYHYGWDWGPRLVTSGIWRPVFLEAWDDARIDGLQVSQTALTDARATLTVRATIIASRPCRCELKVSAAKHAAKGPVRQAGGTASATITPALSSGPNSVEVQLFIEHPERWWPNGLGTPTLYALDAALSIEGAPRGTCRTRVGLRTLEVVHRPDAKGKSFSVSVNGAPVFMKGANYIPSDSFPSRVTEERYRFLLESAAGANMNMLRVWGGGVYEDDRFYDLCDELGLLVWQDFMFACSMYPGDDDFLENVRLEALQNVRRLRNHACLALWAGNNEIEVAWQKWGWQRKFDLSADAQRKIWDDYRRLFHELLPTIVAEEDPGRFYTRSSPSA
ncbi:MAG: glycoside hydrolase family 2 protein, partial [Myxococcales bacterium]|nr:glycoside hydrolase family 2 protein [Myxococcales bacterium]